MEIFQKIFYCNTLGNDILHLQRWLPGYNQKTDETNWKVPVCAGLFRNFVHAREKDSNFSLWKLYDLTGTDRHVGKLTGWTEESELTVNKITPALLVGWILPQDMSRMRFSYPDVNLYYWTAKSLWMHSDAIFGKQGDVGSRSAADWAFPVAVMREIKISDPGREDPGMQPWKESMEAYGGEFIKFVRAREKAKNISL